MRGEVATYVLSRASRLTDRPLTPSRLHSMIGGAWHRVGFAPDRRSGPGDERGSPRRPRTVAGDRAHLANPPPPEAAGAPHRRARDMERLWRVVRRLRQRGRTRRRAPGVRLRRRGGRAVRRMEGRGSHAALTAEPITYFFSRISRSLSALPLPPLRLHIRDVVEMTGLAVDELVIGLVCRTIEVTVDVREAIVLVAVPIDSSIHS